MGIQNPIRKGLTIAVILLFIGVVFAPSINADVSNSELVEFDVELCGLGKKHTVRLSQQEADEVDLLFDDIEQQLSEVETREEAEEIFNDAIVELDKYGLLGGLSVRQALKLVTGKYQDSNDKKLLEKYYSKNNGKDIINRFCFVVVYADGYPFTSNLFTLAGGIIFVLGLIPFILFNLSGYLLFNIFLGLMDTILVKNPFRFLTNFGFSFLGWESNVQSFYSIGLDGYVEGDYIDWIYGFTGIIITDPSISDDQNRQADFLYLGHAFKIT